MRRIDYLERRMNALEDRLQKVEDAVSDVRPDDDPEMRERVGQALGVVRTCPCGRFVGVDHGCGEALGVEDRTQPPPWAVITGFAEPSHPQWSWNVRDPRDDTDVIHGSRDGALKSAWAWHDRITAPLRAECERLRAEVETQKEFARMYWAASSENASRAEKAEAALADCQRERDEARAEWQGADGKAEAMRAALADCQRERDDAHRDFTETVAAIRKRSKEQLANARRSTIEELIREAEAQPRGGDHFAAQRGSALIKWLRSQLDTEPTEQPCPRCDGNDNEPGSMADCELCGGATEQPTPDAPSTDHYSCESCGCDVAIPSRAECLAEARKQERERCARVAEGYRSECCENRRTSLREVARSNWGIRANAGNTIACRIRAMTTEPESDGDQ